ncbi:MAG TPA: hypothetical protein PLH19_10335 [Anaerolineae bacterium]|nr:hypothetical protein [Anaerolineae bacterium]HQH38914.1 hypothetical protein [Anaerolineae bacterium]
MSEVTLGGTVTEQLERVALQIGETPQVLAERAVREFLRALTRQALHQEVQVFRACHADMLQTYAGRYIAMYQGQVVDDDTDQLALLARIEEQYPYTPVLITQVVSEPEETYTSRSPWLRSLDQNPAFGCWRERQIDSMHYQEALRAEWDLHL